MPTFAQRVVEKARRLMGLRLDRVDLVDAPANPGARIVLLKRDGSGDAPGTFEIVKADQMQRVVYGWGNVSVDDGGLVTDRQGDQIDPAELEQAVVQFMLDSRDSGVNHEGAPVAKVVTSFVTTKDVVKAFGLGDDVPEGWMLGVKVLNDSVWQAVVNGDLKAFSIQGSAAAAPADTNDDAAPDSSDADVIGKRHSQGKDTAMADSIRKIKADALEERVGHLRKTDPLFSHDKHGRPRTKQQAYAKATLPVNRGGDKICNDLMKEHEEARKRGEPDVVTPDKPVAKRGSADQQIEALAAGLVRKSGDRLSIYQARELVYKQRPDLVRQYWIEEHGRDPFRDPAVRS